MAPPGWLRGLGWCGGFGAITLVAMPFLMAQRLEQPERLVDSLQSLDSAITIFAGAVAGFFTMRSLEAGYSQRKALNALQLLRQAAHLTDMLQINKAPAKLLFSAPGTASSPIVDGDPIELARYLVYCSEIYSLLAKLSLLYGMWVPTATVLSASGDIEDLCADLEQRTSAKLLQLDTVLRHGTISAPPRLRA